MKSTRLSKLVEHMVGQDRGLVIAIYSRDAFYTARDLWHITQESKPSQGVITTHNGDKILLLGYREGEEISRGWIQGGQPNGVIFYDLINVAATDLLYAASRVHRPKGLFKNSKVVSLLANGTGVQSLVGTFHVDYFVLEHIDED